MSTWRASAAAFCRLGFDRLFGVGLLLLALLDQQRDALALLGERRDVALQPLLFLGDLPADPHQLGEVGGQRFGLHAHFRQHGAEHDGGADRRQRVLRPHHHRRRRIAADALQRRQHLGDGGAAAVERLADAALVLVERLEPSLGFGDPRLRSRASARRRRSAPD